MPLPTPNLDDRTWSQLVEEAKARIPLACPSWTDLSESDPGIVLLELFAYLTDALIYRLNQLPDKAYVEFLSLIGVRLRPPGAASTTVVFTAGRAPERPIEIPRGTRVAVDRAGASGETPVFVTGETVAIPARGTEVGVIAFHCEQIDAEGPRFGTGQPGLSFTVKRPPIVAPTGDGLDLIVGVEAGPDERDERAPAIQFDGRPFRVWREADNFTTSGPDDRVYVVDRGAGIITFAPAARMPGDGGDLSAQPLALAGVPESGREIRVWYRRGGGPEGNVAAGTLNVIKDPVAGVTVTNPRPAVGGRGAESLENAVVRGPQELHSLERAVTARDFELLALRSSGAVVRAKAVTRAAVWAHATPGTVEVLLVANLTDGPVTSERLVEHQTEEARAQIQAALDAARTMGTMCLVNWARCKTVRVTARAVVRRQEDVVAVRDRIHERLTRSINPIPSGPRSSGWAFGQSLRVAHVYDIVLSEPGVRYVEDVKLLVDDFPGAAVGALAADRHQPHTWYAGCEETLFRSLNDGKGWEVVARFPGEHINSIRLLRGRPGLVAVSGRLVEGGGSRLHITFDCGESWLPDSQTGFEVEDVAWMVREGSPILLLATDVGLYEQGSSAGDGPVQVLVDRDDPDKGFYAVAVNTDPQGQVSVAAAAQGTAGVYLSSEAARPGTFRRIGLAGEDIRVLAVQREGPRSFLWAGAFVAGGDDPGKGAYRWELRGVEDPPEGWVPFGRNWTGGSCRALTFRDAEVVAGTHHSGVVRLDTSRAEAAWEAPNVRCGLPMRDPGRFHPVDTVASDPDGRLIMAGGPEGVVRSDDGGVSYESASLSEFSDTVTLPETWLFCSGAHDIVVTEQEHER